jgi:monoterpene epsilon-lactone hydrolase
MLKRFMDVFYASVDTAASITSSTKSQDWQLHLATAAAATYYSLTGASARADEVTSSSQSARQLLEKAWGMVSLPAIKNLSLRTFKLVKGAAVADRIKIGNVPCFVLSRESFPELAAGITRFHRQHVGGPKLIHRLSTIDERKEHFPEASPPLQPFGQGDFRQRDVILHLTGGGFFAHFIASDLPYLLDWSAATGAVIVCPEYSLLPEHPFPCALYDVESVYESLLDPSIANLLGFQVNRIILTGESAGGNLAAALCVKLQMEKLEDTTEHQEVDSEDESSHPTRLPDAVLLSCPVLDLTMQGRRHFDEPTESDPVLSTGLVSAISDSYVPSGRQKSNPLISPLHGSDQVLAHFPPTLIFASSNDPVLDDSVAFNQRLRSLGVESDLRAVGNLPHAYLGLGTAGFPEAQQAQQQITAWLTQKLGHPKNTHNN